MLDLSRCRLLYIPPQVFELTHLKQLNLSDNRITSLPHSILNLTNLQDLYLINNQLVYIPRDISSLTTLTELALYKNPKLIYPPYTLVGNGYRCVATEVKEYLRTNPQTYTRYGRRDHLWQVIRLMYIGHSDPNCTTSFNMIPQEVIAKIEYYVLCYPYVPLSLLEQAILEGKRLTDTEMWLAREFENKVENKTSQL